MLSSDIKIFSPKIKLTLVKNGLTLIYKNPGGLNAGLSIGVNQIPQIRRMSKLL
jgi:hypothetical protein